MPAPKTLTSLTRAALLVLLSTAPVAMAQAEDLALPVGSQAERSATNMPEHGLSQASVRSRWGEPQAVRGPVGQPPITRWVYATFTVYFEGDRVIHSVLNPK